MRFELNSICFLLHQFCEKRKAADLVGLRIHIYFFDSALPEGLFMLFVERGVHFLPVTAESVQQALVGAQRGDILLTVVLIQLFSSSSYCSS